MGCGGAEILPVKRLNIFQRVRLQLFFGRKSTAKRMIGKENLQEAFSGERSRLCLVDGQLAAQIGLQSRDFRRRQRWMLEHIGKKSDELRSEIREHNPADGCKFRAGVDF